eukprot:6192322-Pleurochrysis_carterae.AAC.2
MLRLPTHLTVLENNLSMPFNAIMHAQRSAEATVTACTTGRAIFKCHEPVPARAATSHLVQNSPYIFNLYNFKTMGDIGILDRQDFKSVVTLKRLLASGFAKPLPSTSLSSHSVSVK